MGEDWGSWFHQQQFDWQSPNLNYLGAPYNLGQQYTAPSFMNSGTDMVSIKGTLPVYPPPELSHLHVGQAEEPHGWFYRLPCFRQAFMPALNSGLKEKLVTVPCVDHKEAIAPKVEPGCHQKKFLVFDQSGDQTTLIFSSGTGAPVQCFTSWSPNPIAAYNLKREDHGTKENIHLEAISANQFGGKNDTELQSDMHEDTEELNALLYSDDDSDSTDDDEVTSTGGYSVLPALMDTASSMKPIRSCEFEDDAESRCEDGLDWTSGEMNSEPTKKRIRKERIRETVSILQNIIPGGKGKDATVVLDEAINYLKSLKLKAKALGLDAS
ncbi:hypothetical protein GH714_026246 [Hevea brasiliensis]|uniref:BHLH domain-containing protein n=1 Tax=Hevea brasiliensis TaxID=3981 RepID=A0A6A6LCI6_HEVBR|nr:hypothetical protein GH714_026246 [Hevea brasiliensis]